MSLLKMFSYIMLVFAAAYTLVIVIAMSINVGHNAILSGLAIGDLIVGSIGALGLVLSTRD